MYRFTLYSLQQRAYIHMYTYMYTYKSKEDIKPVVQEAERYKPKEKQRHKVFSKNSLESYSFNMKATVQDAKFQGKSMTRRCRRFLTSVTKSSTA